MHPDDMESRGWLEGDRVDVCNETGEMKNLLLAPFAIKPGNVMTYFPEANILIPCDSDVRSRTPGFKSVPVSVNRHHPEQ